jgi:transcriptional regulator with GAF, ATPase, and Fis domain
VAETLKQLRTRHRKEERALIRSALLGVGWNLTRAAEELGTNKAFMQRAVQRLGLEDEHEERKLPPHRPRG